MRLEQAHGGTVPATGVRKEGKRRFLSAARLSRPKGDINPGGGLGRNSLRSKGSRARCRGPAPPPASRGSCPQSSHHWSCVHPHSPLVRRTLVTLGEAHPDDLILT